MRANVVDAYCFTGYGDDAGDGSTGEAFAGRAASERMKERPEGVAVKISSRLPPGSWKYSDHVVPWVTVSWRVEASLASNVRRSASDSTRKATCSTRRGEPFSDAGFSTI